MFNEAGNIALKTLKSSLADQNLSDLTAETLCKLISEIPIGITIADARIEDNPIIYCNQSFCKLTGYEPHEVLVGTVVFCKVLKQTRRPYS